MTELWNWRVDGRVTSGEIRVALGDVLDRPVLPLGAEPERLPTETLLYDTWWRSGDFPTSVDCYFPPPVSETMIVAAFARRIGRHCLLPDDTLDPGRYLLVAPDGTMRPVHFDVAEDDDGEVLSHQRLCTISDPRCPSWSQCRQSRWAPDSVVAALAAA